MNYVSPEVPEICRDPHHGDPRIPHGVEPCGTCPDCLRPIKAEYAREHQRVHELEHAYHEPTSH